MASSNDEVEYWFTANGNHIPVKKGHSKEQALSEFLKSKGDVQGYSANELKDRLKISIGKQKARKSLEKQIKIHKDKIVQPEVYINDWDNRSAEYKKGIINYWQKEINNFEKQIDKLR